MIYEVFLCDGYNPLFLVPTTVSYASAAYHYDIQLSINEHDDDNDMAEP